MRVAVVGCGFVADFYLNTLSVHPQLEVTGVMDQDRDRAARFAEHHSVARYPSLEALLEDPRVDIVLNLTNPRNHFAVSRACLEAGKHVYSEKPLAMRLAEAQKLVELAEQRGLYLSTAPCTLLSETAQTIWRALRENIVGKVRLVYAEQDDGLVHQMPYRRWFSESGAPWPYRDEFEVGCTIEHAGYYLTWLPVFFGPARRVSAFSSCLIPDKGTDHPLEINAPDFSVASIQFTSGVVARLTCSIIASHDHSLRLFGDEGILQTDDCWRFGSPVYVRRRINIRRRSIQIPWKRKVPLVRPWNPPFRYRGSQQMDFCRGVAELAEAVEEGRPCRLSARFCLHVTELALAISKAGASGASYKIRSSFDPIEPMPWARGVGDSD
jgi:predicted dehydrogenase